MFAPRCLPTLALALMLAACAGPVRSSGPTRTLAAPEGLDARHSAVDALGQAAWGALRRGEPERLLVDDVGLRELVDGASATRFSMQRRDLRRRLRFDPDTREVLAHAEYAGVCAQGSREEDPGGALGLRAPTWSLGRVLVIGRRPGGRRIASWLEGVFVFTDAGFRALDLERIELPRWEHSDLEIATCDHAVRSDLPEIAR